MLATCGSRTDSALALLIVVAASGTCQFISGQFREAQTTLRADWQFCQFSGQRGRNSLPVAQMRLVRVAKKIVGGSHRASLALTARLRCKKQSDSTREKDTI